MIEPSILACPICLGEFGSDENGNTLCIQCNQQYCFDGESLQIDFRPKTKVIRELTHQIAPASESPPFFGTLEPNPDPTVSFENVRLPPHLTTKMASYIPKAKSKSSLALDIGCGNGEYKDTLCHAGYKWVGCDYSHPNAPMLVDAHCMPFKNGSFEFAISLAVLEHLRLPTVALRDILRVLSPGGYFLGSVTYLAPFHDAASYFNMTHAGVSAALADAGFETIFVCGEKTYMGMHALSFGGLFLGAPRKLAYSIANPILFLSRLWWSYRRSRKMFRSDTTMEMLINTGAFVFLARRPK